ncbi:hypothetical protein Rs2_29062 [Raphanus sativus]|nr:hypothetical protein Rs2_29062 [Raphanus sativus]
MRELDADNVILGEGYPSFVGDRRGPAFRRNCLSMIVLHRSDQFAAWWGPFIITSILLRSTSSCSGSAILELILSRRSPGCEAGCELELERSDALRIVGVAEICFHPNWIVGRITCTRRQFLGWPHLGSYPIDRWGGFIAGSSIGLPDAVLGPSARSFFFLLLQFLPSFVFGFWGSILTVPFPHDSNRASMRCHTRDNRVL